MNKINAICRCGKQNEIFIRAFEDSISKYSEYKCLSCIIKARGSKNGDGMRNKVKAAIGYLNSDIILLRCVRCNNIIRIKYGSYKGWKNKHLDLQEYMCGSCFNRAQDRSSSRTIEHKKKCSERSKSYWLKPEYRTKLIRHLAEVRSLGPGPSNLEKSVWRILDDLNVKFMSARDGKSFVLGPWSFDIFIDKSERKSTKHLLIEVDGFYRHNRADVVGYDKAKETYISTYFNEYELVRILEHEFLSIGKLKHRIEILLGKSNIIPQEIELSDLNVKLIEFEQSTPFLGAYHYLGFVNKRGVPIGCFYKDELIGVALFAGMTRNQTVNRLLLKSNQCRELIRFCISPYFHNKNLGSWFLSKSISLLHSRIPELLALVTFADTTVGHVGILYKATNFEFDGQCGHSYCWLGTEGFIMHKKTMWDHAIKNGQTEEEMAKKSGYQKLDCLPKNRFIYWFDKEARNNYHKENEILAAGGVVSGA